MLKGLQDLIERIFDTTSWLLSRVLNRPIFGQFLRFKYQSKHNQQFCKISVYTIKKLWTDFRASLYTYFSVGATDRHLLELEDVGEIKCIQFRISGSDGWNIAKVFQVLNI